MVASSKQLFIGPVTIIPSITIYIGSGKGRFSPATILGAVVSAMTCRCHHFPKVEKILPIMYFACKRLNTQNSFLL